MTAEEIRDTTERDLRIAVTQAQGDEARRQAQQSLDRYLASRLDQQIQHRKMKAAATTVDNAGYTHKGAKDD